MPVNVKLLKKVRKLIAEEPRRLRMGIWGIRYKRGEAHTVVDMPPCRTTACLAGHIILATKPKGAWGAFFKVNNSLNFTLARAKQNVPSLAARLIGIPMEDCPFWNYHWDHRQVLAWIDRQIDAASK